MQSGTMEVHDPVMTSNTQNQQLIATVVGAKLRNTWAEIEYMLKIFSPYNRLTPEAK